MAINKTFAVLGCGRFGLNLALTLAEQGAEVLVVDKDEEKINMITEYVTYAVQADVSHEGALDGIGLSNVDVAIVALSSNFEASILATSICNDKGIETIISKAKNERHERILNQIGATKVVLPEKEMGIRLGQSLVERSIHDIIELSDEYSIAEVEVPMEWVGKSLGQIDIRARYNISVIGIIGVGDKNINPNSEDKMREGDRLLVLGCDECIEKIEAM